MKSVKIYEPLYQEGQSLAEPEFIPLALSNDHADWRELRFIVDFYRASKHRQADMSGIFSPKFRLKTNITGAEWIAFINQHQSAALCFCNPFPTLHYYSYNVWMQGEIAHPGLTALAQELLNAVELNWDLSQVPRHNQSNLCYANFWVGSEQFWEAYVGGVLNPIATFIEQNSAHPLVASILKPTYHTDAASFLPFIIERLFSTYLSLNDQFECVSYDLLDKNTSQRPDTEFDQTMLAYLAPKVAAADASGDFSEALIELQSTFCHLSKLYSDVHFQYNVHPHVNKVVKSPD